MNAYSEDLREIDSPSLVYLWLIQTTDAAPIPHWADILEGVGSIASAIVAFIGFFVIYYQVRQIQDTLHSEAHGTLYAQANVLLTTLLEHADLSPYFFEGRDISKEDEDYNRVFLLAQTLTAHFEHVVLQSDYLPHHIRSNWEHYIRTIYSTSPILRQYLKDNKESYSNRLYDTVSIKTKRLSSVSSNLERQILKIYNSNFPPAERLELDLRRSVEKGTRFVFLAEIANDVVGFAVVKR